MIERESDAYAHLLYYGACAKGVVPHCYGWLTLCTKHVNDIQTLPDISETAVSLKDEVNPPKGILIEFFVDAEGLSERNITKEVARNAMKALQAVHAAYVQHDDIHRRNILVLPGGRVVWIDFDKSDNPRSGELYRQTLLRELENAWLYIYRRVVSRLHVISDLVCILGSNVLL